MKHDRDPTPLSKHVKAWLRGLGRIGLQYGKSHAIDARVRRDLFDVSSLRIENRTRNEGVIRGLARSSYLHGTDALCWCLGRYRMFVDTSDIGFSTFMMMDGYWEISVTEALVARLRPGMHVVDCGANLGYYSLISADLIGPSGSLHCFEPNPGLVRRLRSSISVNGFDSRTTIHPVALGNEEGDMVLAVPVGEPKNGHRSHVLPNQIGDQPNLHHVQVKRLDTVLADRPVDFIKIDVEGAEEMLWEGMAGILARGRPLTVLLEFAADRYREPARFVDQVIGAGFRLEIVRPDEGVVATSRDEILAAPGNIDQMLLLTR